MRNLNNWLTQNYGLLVEPDDGHWHAVLTSYDDKDTFEGIGSSPNTAIEDALTKAEETGKHPHEFEGDGDVIGYCPPECKDGDRDLCQTCLVKEQEAKKACHSESLIILQQDCPCGACGEMMRKGDTIKFVLASAGQKGGLYHPECHKAEEE